jgi:hypothetical protein
MRSDKIHWPKGLAQRKDGQLRAERLESGLGGIWKWLGLRKEQASVGGRKIQQSGGSMPLFTVTMKSDGSTNEKDRLSRAIHAASIAAGYPEDDLFQRFLSVGTE